LSTQNTNAVTESWSLQLRVCKAREFIGNPRWCKLLVSNCVGGGCQMVW
jgi:hypothetical protein